MNEPGILACLVLWKRAWCFGFLAENCLLDMFLLCLKTPPRTATATAQAPSPARSSGPGAPASARVLGSIPPSCCCCSSSSSSSYFCVAAAVVATMNGKRSWAWSAQALLVLLLAGATQHKPWMEPGGREPFDGAYTVTPSLDIPRRVQARLDLWVGPEYNTLRRNWPIGCNLTKEVETSEVRIARKQALLDWTVSTKCALTAWIHIPVWLEATAWRTWSQESWRYVQVCLHVHTSKLFVGSGLEVGPRAPCKTKNMTRSFKSFQTFTHKCTYSVTVVSGWVK